MVTMSTSDVVEYTSAFKLTASLKSCHKVSLTAYKINIITSNYYAALTQYTNVCITALSNKLINKCTMLISAAQVTKVITCP